MGITYIPGPDQVINSAIDNLATGLDKFLNPNKGLQLAVRNAAATNPELLQHMADIEAQNPGTMTRLGLGTVADVIASVKPSAAAVAEQAIRPGAAKQATAQQGAATANAGAQTEKANLDSKRLKLASQMIDANPSLSTDAALQVLTGQTSAQRTTEETKAAVTTAEGKRQLEQLQRAGQLPEDLSKVDWKDQARQFLDGNLPGSLATAYFGNSDTSKAFQESIQAIMQQRQIDASKALAAVRGDNTIDNFRIQKSFQEYQRSGGVGNLDTWQKFLFDPATQARAKQLLSGTTQPGSEEDRDLLKIAQVTKQQVDLDKIRDVTMINDKINTQLKKANDATDDSEREVLLNGLNQLLDQRAALGGMKIKAVYNDRGLWLPGRIEYRDPTGKPLDEVKVNAVLSDPLGTDIMQSRAAATSSPVIERAITALSKPGANVEASLKIFESQDNSPDKANSKALRAALVERGLLKP